jgi:SAM-dependent methyltransferase
MKLTNLVSGSHVPKLLGSYEQELHGVISEVIAETPPYIVDVGCGEGYYVIGLARRIPGTVAIGYDISESAQSACIRNASLNSVGSRVRVHGKCDHATLNELPLERSVLIVDCEGFELELLDPKMVPGLQKCRVLVELHEALAAGVTRELLDRFSSTHSIRLIDSQARDPREYALLKDLPPRHAAMAIDECRGGPMQWAWMKPLVESV